MKRIYILAGEVVGISWTGPGAAGVVVTSAHEDAVTVDVDVAFQVEVGWLDMTEDKGPKFQPRPTPAPTIGPNEFYFLWTMAEQVAIEQLRDTDVGVKLFMRRLDDVRTTEVVLSDPAVQVAVRHTVEQLVEAGVITAANAEARIAGILAGPLR